MGQHAKKPSLLVNTLAICAGHSTEAPDSPTFALRIPDQVPTVEKGNDVGCDREVTAVNIQIHLTGRTLLWGLLGTIATFVLILLGSSSASADERATVSPDLSAAGAQAVDDAAVGTLVDDLAGPITKPVTDGLAPAADPIVKLVEKVVPPVVRPVTQVVEKAARPVTEPLANVNHDVVAPVIRSLSPLAAGRVTASASIGYAELAKTTPTAEPAQMSDDAPDRTTATAHEPAVRVQIPAPGRAADQALAASTDAVAPRVSDPPTPDTGHTDSPMRGMATSSSANSAPVAAAVEAAKWHLVPPRLVAVTTPPDTHHDSQDAARPETSPG